MSAPNPRIYKSYYSHGMAPYVSAYRGQTYAQAYPGRSATMDDNLSGMGYVEPHTHPCSCAVAAGDIDVLGFHLPTWMLLAGVGYYLYRKHGKRAA